VARDLLVYLINFVCLEPDSLNKFARKIDQIKCIPVPFYQTLNQPWHSRSIKIKGLDQLERARDVYFNNFQEIKRVYHARWKPVIQSACQAWWENFWSGISSNLLPARDHFIAKLSQVTSVRKGKRPSNQLSYPAPIPKKSRQGAKRFYFKNSFRPTDWNLTKYSFRLMKSQMLKKTSLSHNPCK